MQDYDDSYTIMYAQKHDGCVVTNDRYRDYLEKIPLEDKDACSAWLKSHCISFTFAGASEFMPNPDFVFPPPAQLSGDLKEHMGLFESSKPLFDVHSPMPVNDGGIGGAGGLNGAGFTGGELDVSADLPGWMVTPNVGSELESFDPTAPSATLDILKFLGLQDVSTMPVTTTSTLATPDGGGGGSLLELQESLLRTQRVPPTPVTRPPGL